MYLLHEIVGNPNKYGLCLSIFLLILSFFVHITFNNSDISCKFGPSSNIEYAS